MTMTGDEQRFRDYLLSWEQIGIIMGVLSGCALTIFFGYMMDIRLLIVVGLLITILLLMIGMPLIVIDLGMRMISTDRYYDEIMENWRKQNERFRKQGYDIIT